MGDAQVVEDGRVAGPSVGNTGDRRRRLLTAVLTVGCLVLAALCGVSGWRLWQFDVDQSARQDAQRVARQNAMNLATIDHRHAEQDVQRVLAGATGEFRDDFQANAASFVSVVQGAEVTTVGQQADAAVESWDGAGGSVLVQVASTVTNRTQPEPQARVWRLRMTMEQVDGVFRTARLEYLA